MHVKSWLNQRGGTKDHEIKERLAEYSFFRQYIKSRNPTSEAIKEAKELAWWRMLRVVALKGKEAQTMLEQQN